MRRVISVSSYLFIFLLLVANVPVFFTLALLADIIRPRRWFWCRAIAYAYVFFSAQLAGLAGAAYLGVVHSRDSARYYSSHYALQRWWIHYLFSGVCRLFRLKINVEGIEQARQTPFLLFIRHTSLADTLLPGYVIGSRFKTPLRYVMKKELLSDPCIDIVANRLPNYFVDRGGDGRRELAGIRRLAENLPPEDVVLIYPEGTRFTPEKRSRVLRSLEKRSPRLYDIAKDLHHVLPPRPGGALALIEATQQKVDVVFMAHRGFDRLATVQDWMSGQAVDTVIDVKFWRVAAADIPTGKDAQTRWLFEQWKGVDDFAAEGRKDG